MDMKRNFSEVEIDPEDVDSFNKVQDIRERLMTEAGRKGPGSRPPLTFSRWIQDKDVGLFSLAFLQRLLLITTFIVLGCGIELLIQAYQFRRQLGGIVGKTFLSWILASAGVILCICFLMSVLAIERKK